MQPRRKLDPSSPIVQRVLLLRERKARKDAEENVISSRIALVEEGYQWQMWQKSDFSAYMGRTPEHTCKSVPAKSGGR